MNIGFVGCGKLGLPVAVCMAMRGHEVICYDIDPDNMTYEPRSYIEAGPDGKGDFNELLSLLDNEPLNGNPYMTGGSLRFADLPTVCASSEIIFVAVQTPHAKLYEGVTPLPDKRVDFDYSYLKAAVAELAEYVNRDTVIAVISTVLPGTMRREIMPLLNEHMRLVYNPSFIAMGTTMRDFLHPEFVLIGHDGTTDAEEMRAFYSSITDAPQRVMSIESAELSKVAYNTFISAKIGIVNALMEICDKIPGADIDAVSDALCTATRRVISPAYMRGGMGDGGGCHPRDNIAMSWLARELGLGHDMFESVMLAREAQAKWLARMLIDLSADRNLPIGILGTAFKAGSGIETGSHALLVLHALRDLGYYSDVYVHDPYIRDIGGPQDLPGIWLVGCNHPEFVDYSFAAGSVIVDPWRYIPPQEGVEIIRLGSAGRGIVV